MELVNFISLFIWVEIFIDNYQLLVLIDVITKVLKEHLKCEFGQNQPKRNDSAGQKNI